MCRFHWTRCLTDLERIHVHHMNLVSYKDAVDNHTLFYMRHAGPVHMQHINVVPCKMF